MDEMEPETTRKGGWRRSLKVVFLSLLYMIPLFWLWIHANYPDSLGVHITAHGKTGLLENWWYSYLLVERHQVLDVVTFLYMWAPAVVFLGWLARSMLLDRKAAAAREPRR